jgi:hypothetical protein
MLTWKSYKYKMSEGLLLTFCIYTGKEPQKLHRSSHYLFDITDEFFC